MHQINGKLNTMTKVQRELIEQVIARAERGPTMMFTSLETCEADAKRWAQTWIEAPLRALLRNVDGEVSANDLRFTAMGL